MDKDRQIRFLYPPLIFLSSLALGVRLDYPNELSVSVSNILVNPNATIVLAALLGLGSLVLVLGYLIGTFTILLLRFLFFNNNFNYEFKLSKATYEKIGELILKNKNDGIGKNEKMYAAVVFDHSYINDRIHSWIVRRWNGFMTASFSVTGLISSLFVGPLLGISITFYWFFTVLIFSICFAFQARFSWRETMRMITFLTGVKRNDA